MRASQTVLPVTAHSLSFSDSARAVADEELQLTERALRRNPKSYGAWHHRRWSVRRLGTRADTGHELALCAQLLAADERNFHCWNYRRFVDECHNGGKRMRFAL